MNTSVETILLYTIAAGLLSIVYGYFTGKNILNQSAGNAKMQEIASAIQIGAKAYLTRQYKTIAVVGVVVLVIICLVFSPLVGLGYFIGATLSPTLSAITAGFLGSSSGMPASTLPTKSAPTSAPLVKIPPPNLAKIEIREAPNPNATNALTTSLSAIPNFNKI